MKIGKFQDLIVWVKAHELILDIYDGITKTFPKEEKFSLVNQIRRSAVSICANISEGYKKTRKDFARYLDISQGSLEETKYFLKLSRDLDYCKDQEFYALIEKSNKVGKMLNGLIRSLKTIA